MSGAKEVGGLSCAFCFMLFFVLFCSYLVFPGCTTNRDAHAEVVELPVWSASPENNIKNK